MMENESTAGAQSERTRTRDRHRGVRTWTFAPARASRLSWSILNSRAAGTLSARRTDGRTGRARGGFGSEEAGQNGAGQDKNQRALLDLP